VELASEERGSWLKEETLAYASIHLEVASLCILFSTRTIKRRKSYYVTRLETMM
jgi:hypothetical protein